MGTGDRGPGTGPTFALVAGEDSGDQLGADLIEALRARFPDARFVGVGGPRMRAAGFDAWHDIADLSVMGLAEVLLHLPRLLRLRATLAKRLLALQPDAFVGIDAPDFNLGLEEKLKRAGIRTIHYVSPSIWAWREGRAAKIGAAADRVLCLFPMEPAIYTKYGVNACFVGHPLADRFALNPDTAAARRELGLDATLPVLTVLPGSRRSEIRRLGRTFLDAAHRVADAIPGLQIAVPAANERCHRELQSLIAGTTPSDPARGAADARPGGDAPTLFSVLPPGKAHRAMVAADVVLLASGTAALEAMLAKRPMVVGYRISALTHALVKGFGMLKTRVFSLPNALAGRAIVPELMQDDCTPDKLANAMLAWFRDPEAVDALRHEFERMHLSLHVGGGSAAAAARAISDIIATSPDPAGRPDAA